ncbi:hypothetical protein DDQ41_12400 [Streptomyces spongiicola]|uniref:Uncharacterized protein n=1 Tax=Streptomyces spongiicola TaxID=1690221 RepID=A0ABM6V6W7_9ACTN|nr:hypothetical protein DDQ41_12400 [Streptomyces spongiicola]
MALPKRRSRIISVDGTSYRWFLRGRPPYCQGMAWSRMTYAVEHAEHPGAVLMVETSRAHTGNWVGAESAPVLPAEVADSIRRARLRGWEPTSPGMPFRLTPTTDNGISRCP